MAVIGVTRNVRLRRRGASGFGFSLRGGREYAAGFYVSDVQPGSEAHRNGLRVNSQVVVILVTVISVPAERFSIKNHFKINEFRNGEELISSV